LAPPRKPTRGRTRRRVKKNIAIGQAHIKTSFNNTIVALTDREGAVIVWESAGSAGFKGSRKSTPFAAQVTADSAARKGMEHGLQKVEVFDYALDTTDGLDLERVLWLKSSSSETWLQRRTMYTRSVAVMSSPR